MTFDCYRYDFLPMNYDIAGECSQKNVATFECGDIWGKSSLVGEEKPAAGITASS